LDLLEVMLILNYKPVLRQPTGIGVYANAVFPAFNQFEHILIPAGGSGGVKERLKRLTWSQFELPTLARERKADLIFTPAPEGYLGEQIVPQVVMVHDLRPLSHPERSAQSFYFKYWVPPLLRQCRHVLTNSNATAEEICLITGLPQEKISVTPLGYDADHFFPSDEYRRLHHRDYLLHIGQAYPHKNLERLITAFKKISLRFPDIDLVLLGKPHPFETIRLQQLSSDLDLSERVIFKSYVPYEDLPNWYRGAVAFVYPSLWEGFGLPILEAMACGCPVITSYGTATEEVSGNAARLIDPFSQTSLIDAIDSILSSHSSRNRLISLGLSNVSMYSWHKTRQGTAKLLKVLLKNS